MLTLPTNARAGDNNDWDADLSQVVLTGDEDGTAMGTAVAMGDLNGDGFDDMVISAPELDVSGTWYGEVYVLFGPEDGSHELTDTSEADAIIVGVADGDHFGHSLAIGDLNGDGVEDLVVGAPFAGSGTVYVFDGGNISSTLVASSADVIIEGDSSGENAGYALAVADLDEMSSGLELAIGAPNYSRGDGAVYVFHASTIAWPSSPLDTGADADFVYYGEDEEEAGYALVAAYQNDDDEANLAIGAPEAGTGDEGRVYLLEANMASYTGPDDLSDSSYAIIENEAGTTGFGFAMGDAYGHTHDSYGGGDIPWLVVGAEYVSGSDGDVHFFKDPWNDLSLVDTDDAAWWTHASESLPVTVEGKSFALLRGVCVLGNAVAFGDPDAYQNPPTTKMLPQQGPRTWSVVSRMAPSTVATRRSRVPAPHPGTSPSSTRMHRRPATASPGPWPRETSTGTGSTTCSRENPEPTTTVAPPTPAVAASSTGPGSPWMARSSSRTQTPSSTASRSTTPLGWRSPTWEM